VDLDHLALTLGGVDADTLLRLAEESRGSAVDSDRIGEVKSAEITRTAAGTIEVLRTGDGKLAGLWNLRYYLAGRQAAKLPIGPVLLCGPPGCGKTLSFLWLARQLGLPAVKLGQLRGPFVGTSEENWLRARRTLEACSPVCVLLDEVEMIGLGVRGANMDSGVSDRMREGLLGILNDASDLGIVFVLASNNPAGIDVAGINRAMVLPVLNPTVNEAVEILMIEANKRLWALESSAALEVLTGRKELLTGRGLVRLLHSAAVIAARHERAGTILAEDVQSAFDLSLEAGDSPRQEYMALCALAHAESRDAWPWVAAMALGHTPEIPPYVLQLMDSMGELNLVSLRQRIDDLKAAGYGF
jgi:hypothetical protein